MKPAQKTESKLPETWANLKQKAETSTFKKIEDANGFTKDGTNFYVKADEPTAEIVFLDPDTFPLTVNVHSVKMKSKNGKEYYATETCQLSEQDNCVLCTAKKAGNEAIGSSYPTFLFTVLDLRGKRDKDGKFDGIPTPMIWAVTKKVMLQIIEHKEKYEDLSGLIFEVKKLNKDTYVNVKMEKDPNNPRVQVMATYEGTIPPALPNREFLWQPQSDKDLERMLSN